MAAAETRVELRPRSAYEAADLGIAMLRTWWRPLAQTWCAIVLPLAAIAMIALRDYPWIAVAVLWWLRPLFARVPLHVLSRKTFGQPTGVVETLESLPQLARSGILSSLTFLRFSPARTLLLPVLQLEGLRGSARRSRSALLASRDLGAAMAVMTVGAHLTGVLALGVYGGVYLLIPEDVAWDFGSLFTPFFKDVDMGWAALLLPGMYFCATSIVEHILVAAGFSMYLNRRVFLEGWDIEIALRRLAERTQAKRPKSKARFAALVLAGTIAAAVGAPNVGSATDFDAAACVEDDPQTANACAAAIIAAGEFGGVQEVEWWQLRDFDFEDDEPSEDLDWFGAGLARFFELVLWLALGIGLLLLASAIVKNLEFGRRPPPQGPPMPTRLFGLDLRPSSLPQDLVGEARAAWLRGEFIEAMSLLYRGALVHLIEARGVRIPESATEYECVALVKDSAHAGHTETVSVFKDLTQAWVGTRYATSPPAEATFDALCASFGRAFPTPSAEPDEQVEA